MRGQRARSSWRRPATRAPQHRHSPPATTAAGGGYATISGTSAAAAEVAGAAALLRASSFDATNGVIVGRLARNADPAGTADQTGNGRLNLLRGLWDTSTDPIEPTGSPPVGG